MEPAFALLLGLASALTLGHKFQLKSPVTFELQLAIEHWLWEGLGGMVIGLPGLGKTCAMRWVLKQLSAVFGFSIPWVEIPMRKSKKLQDEDAFFRFLLKQIKHREWNKGDADYKRDVFERWLFSKAKKNNLRTLILFVDEAQFLTLNQVIWLHNTQVDLAAIPDEACRLLIFLNGSMGIHKVREMVEEAGLDEVIRRFMTDRFDFRGLITQGELQDVLAEFDKYEYPVGSGRTLSSWFMQHSGRVPILASISAAYWAGFEEVWDKRLPDLPLELPMACVFRGLARLLRISNQPDVTDLTPELISTAVAASGLDELLLSRSRGEFGEDDDDDGDGDGQSQDAVAEGA